MEDNREAAIAVLNRLVELELAGAVRYTQYSL
jgi:bacterioferritin (cytochrome b1)